MGNDARAAEFMKGRRVMEVNPGHPIIQGLKAKVDLESRWVLGVGEGAVGDLTPSSGCWEGAGRVCRGEVEGWTGALGAQCVCLCRAGRSLDCLPTAAPS